MRIDEGGAALVGRPARVGGALCACPRDAGPAGTSWAHRCGGGPGPTMLWGLCPRARRACSSVGQSAALTPQKSSVRDRPGPPDVPCPGPRPGRQGSRRLPRVRWLCRARCRGGGAGGPAERLVRVRCVLVHRPDLLGAPATGGRARQCARSEPMQTGRRQVHPRSVSRCRSTHRGDPPSSRSTTGGAHHAPTMSRVPAGSLTRPDRRSASSRTASSGNRPGRRTGAGT